jgi:hypothetical protein
MAAPAEHIAVSAAHTKSSGPDIPNINPATGLSTDYLNHFTEAVMALEMAGDLPECLEDLRHWQPKTYVQHFAGSRFSRRAEAIRAYWAAQPSVRAELDATSEALNATLAAARDAAIRKVGSGGPGGHKLSGVRSLMSRMAALINGTPDTAESAGAQAEIDAMFGP